MPKENRKHLVLKSRPRFSSSNRSKVSKMPISVKNAVFLHQNTADFNERKFKNICYTKGYIFNIRIIRSFSRSIMIRVVKVKRKEPYLSFS